MSFLLHPLAWPALIKVLSCFALVVAANRLRINLGICLAGGGLLLGLWMGLGPTEAVRLGAEAVVSPIGIRMAMVVVLIVCLSELMKRSGQLQRIVQSFSRLVHSPKAVAVVMPALIGLLPMPGGALFSAPMVEASCANGQKHPGALLATVNYWFRHHGEYWWPLYPGFILAVALLGVDVLKFMLVLLPLAAMHMAVGMLFLLPRLHVQELPKTGRKGGWRAFLAESAPIFVVVAFMPLFALAGAVFLPAGAAEPWPKDLPLAVGLLAAVVLVVITNRIPWRQAVGVLFRRQVAGFAMLVVGIMVFQGMMRSSGAVAAVQGELAHYGIPPLVMMGLLPFIGGLVTGIAVGYVASSFPLLMPFFGPPGSEAFMAHAGLAFVCGFFGMMLSPLHLCFLMSRDYFKCSLAACYLDMAGPLALSALALSIWYFILV